MTHTTHFSGCECVEKELRELRADRKRLEWMIKNGNTLHYDPLKRRWWLESQDGYWKTPREAIDAMKGGE